MISPTAAAFGVSDPPAPAMDSIAARAGLIRPQAMGPPPARRSAPRNRSQSRTRGLYADMHDDFRLLARDVHLNLNTTQIVSAASTVVPSPATTLAASPIIPQPLRTHPPGTNATATITSLLAQRAPSPALSASSGMEASAAGQLRADPERASYTSDGSLTNLPNISTHAYAQPAILPQTQYRPSDNQGGRALLVALARERKETLRREERERAREKVARRLERERERIQAINTLSDCESVASSRSASAAEKTRRVYGSTGLGVAGGTGYESDASLKSRGGRVEEKELVKNAEEIWG